MKLHFVGIGGIGISGLVQLCATKGHEVSGSNQGSTPMFEKLKNLGFKNLYDTHNTCNLPANTDLLIYSEAIPKKNPERERAKELGIKEKSYFEFLGEISHSYTTIAVAGTHGKTTTTGLLTAGFKACEFDASILVGSTLDILDGNNFKAGLQIPGSSTKDPGINRPYLLIEACEYRENFKLLKPDILLITNLEWDHTDYFKNEVDYFSAFKRLAANSKNVLYHQTDDVTHKLLEDVKTNKLSIPAQSAHSWEAILNIWGTANQQNATLALALGHFLKLSTDTFKEGLGLYKGAGRRQEFIGKHNGIYVYDDYGHHPTEIRATLEAFRSQHPNAKIGLIYEPHQYSRTAQFFNEFSDAFRLADFCGLFPIYEARDTQADKASVSLDDFIKDNPKLDLITTLQDTQTFAQKLNNNDLLLFMGAGNISQFAHKFITE